MLNHHRKVAIPLESLFIIDYLRAENSTPFPVLKKLLVKEYEIVEWGLNVTIADFNGCSTIKDLINRVHHLYLRQHEKEVWGQKTPRFVRYGDLLRRTYPSAKFIHIVRDPRAVASSLIRSNVHRSNAYFAALRWVEDVSAGLLLKQKYDEDVFEMRYEELVSSPRQILYNVCRFLNIDFDESMLSYHKSERKEYGRYYRQVHSRLDRRTDISRIDAWRLHLSSRQLTLIEFLCGELMQYFGYTKNEDVDHVQKLYISYLKFQRIIKSIPQFFHYIMTRPQYVKCVIYRKFFLSLLLYDLRTINY
jgi:hypothetical protein